MCMCVGGVLGVYAFDISVYNNTLLGWNIVGAGVGLKLKFIYLSVFVLQWSWEVDTFAIDLVSVNKLFYFIDKQ